MVDSEEIRVKVGLIEAGKRLFVKYPRQLTIVKMPTMSVIKALYE